MMQTKFLILLSFVFTLSLSPLWTACSNEDVPVPVEEPEEEPGAGQVSGSAPLVGTVWFCDTVVNHSGSAYWSDVIPEGSYVCLLSNGTVESDISIFPEGSTYDFDGASLIITTPAKKWRILIRKGYNGMSWIMYVSSMETITLYLTPIDDSQSQGENSNNGGGTVVPVGQ
jgi:hypothetical protein